MAKRLREDESSRVVTEERGAKRHAGAEQLLAPENYSYILPPGCDPLGNAAAPKQQHPGSVGHPVAEPLRPANQLLASHVLGATDGTTPHSLQPQQQQVAAAGSHSPGGAVAAVAAAVAAAGCDIDWSNQEQVGQLLRMLHVERLQRQGLQLPLEYQHT